jgi:hypothetical protein
MAQNFKNQLARNTGTSPVDILAAADSYDTVVGIRLVNVHASSAINVSIYIISTGPVTTYLVKSAPIPLGSSLELIDGGSKIILKSGDKITAVSDVASSLDTVVSYIDAIST